MTQEYWLAISGMLSQSLEALAKKRGIPLPEGLKEGLCSQRQTKGKWRMVGQRLLSEGVMEPFEYSLLLFDLNGIEAFSLALALAYEMDNGYREWFRALGHSSIPNAGLVVEAYGLEKERQKEWYQVFCRNSTLQNCFLRQVSEEDQKSLLDLPLRLDARMAELFLADQWEDPVVNSLGWYEYPHIEEELWMAGQDAYRQWTELYDSGYRGVYHLCGPEGVGKKTQISRFAAERGKTVIHFYLDRMNSMDRSMWRPAISGLLRECRLHQAFLCLEGVCEEHKEGQMQGLLENLLRQAWEELGCIFCLDDSGGSLPGDLTEVTVDLLAPDMGQSIKLWKMIGSGYPVEDSISWLEFASLFSMTPGQMKDACEMAARRVRAKGGRIGAALLKEACRSLLDCGMGDKAKRVECRYIWEDLILGQEAKGHIREACARILGRSRVYCQWGFGSKLAYGTGVSVLFAGPPGTGKTMAAQVMAKELGLSLYKIDLSTVVSKYIGDTEKNLNQIFEAGKRNQCVLFFDEADVLFSKRTEVKDANDKYSNMEAAFLLQRMEEYAGVVILATNYLQNIEEAFKRRLTYVIDFPLPDGMQRKELWKSMFPESLVVDEDVDLEFLAERFELSGSQIKNSILNGAFLALSQGKERVGMKQLVISVQRELKKSGKHLTPQDFGEYYLLIEE